MSDLYDDLLNWAIDIHDGADIVLDRLTNGFKRLTHWLMNPPDPYPGMGPNAPPKPRHTVSIQFPLLVADRIADELIGKFAPAGFYYDFGHTVTDCLASFYVTVGRGPFSHRVANAIRERHRFVVATVDCPDWVRSEYDVVNETNLAVIAARVNLILISENWCDAEYELALKLGVPMPTITNSFGWPGL